MPNHDTTDYPYLRAWARSLGSSTSYMQDRLAEARQDRAPRDVLYHRNTPDTDGRPDYAARSGRVWRRYDHWAMPATTRDQMTAALRQFGVDPAAEADPTPQWRWLEVPEVAWRGWVLHHTGDVLGRVARVMRDDGRAPLPVIWMPFTADGRLIRRSWPSPAEARQAVETFVRRDEHSLDDNTPLVRHEQLPQGGSTRDDEHR